MSKPIITVVAGIPGVGKTSFIRKQIPKANSAVYFSPGTGNVPIDQTCLAIDFPNLKIITDAQESQLIEYLANGGVAFVELGFYLELDAMSSLLDTIPSSRIAIIPPGTKNSEWHQWANQTVEGFAIYSNMNNCQIWRSPTQGQVIDPASLDVFWYEELTAGAYGQIIRAKAIFDIADGRAFYFDFVLGKETEYQELNLPRWLKGRPERFSGIEVFGHNLNQKTLAESLQDCCLPDAAILAYQQQVKETLDITEEELV